MRDLLASRAVCQKVAEEVIHWANPDSVTIGTAGAGVWSLACLALNVRALVICRNEEHHTWLREVVKAHILAESVGNEASGFYLSRASLIDKMGLSPDSDSDCEAPDAQPMDPLMHPTSSNEMHPTSSTEVQPSGSVAQLAQPTPQAAVLHLAAPAAAPRAPTRPALAARESDVPSDSEFQATGYGIPSRQPVPPEVPAPRAPRGTGSAAGIMALAGAGELDLSSMPSGGFGLPEEDDDDAAIVPEEKPKRAKAKAKAKQQKVSFDDGMDDFSPCEPPAKKRKAKTVAKAKAAGRDTTAGNIKAMFGSAKK